jgi:transcription initiation factor IIE alpha subunit
MASRQQFDPLCDLHHVAMRRMMLDDNADEIRSFHACARPDCTRVFRDSAGYLDFIDGNFDDSRSSMQTCPLCGSVLFLAEVDHSRKIETWDCPHLDCDFSQDHPSPSAR